MKDNFSLGLLNLEHLLIAGATSLVLINRVQVNANAPMEGRGRNRDPLLSSHFPEGLYVLLIGLILGKTDTFTIFGNLVLITLLSTNDTENYIAIVSMRKVNLNFGAVSDSNFIINTKYFELFIY